MRSSCRKVRPSLSFKSSPQVEIYLHLKQKKKANPNSKLAALRDEERVATVEGHRGSVSG
ncbi:hypothetical protein NC651_037064 [Populus alba x Populus x berolinensis]|nr:hypothetical protein NC651_037064 [Populus alba x Populus x berolinensis]